MIPVLTLPYYTTVTSLSTFLSHSDRSFVCLHISDDCGADYISELCFAPNQTKEMEEKITELHKTYRLFTAHIFF